MARIRYIKPSFFDDDDVCALKPLTRLLFIGLWCWADKAGRLEDRPQRIKANILPEDPGNVNGMLDSLSGAGFIQRYEAEGRRYIQIKGFEKHQRPHIKEVPSTIPAPNGYVPSTGEGEGTAPTHTPTLSGAQSALEKRDGDGEKRDEGKGVPPLPPANRGGSTPAARAKSGSNRKRDQQALRAIQTPEEHYLGRHAR